MTIFCITLQDQIKEFYKEDHLNKVIVDIDNEKRTCEIFLDKEYAEEECLDKYITYEKLSVLSKICCTNKINVGSKESRGGCETCDFGSGASVTIYLKEIEIYNQYACHCDFITEDKEKALVHIDQEMESGKTFPINYLKILREES